MGKHQEHETDSSSSDSDSSSTSSSSSDCNNKKLSKKEKKALKKKLKKEKKRQKEKEKKSKKNLISKEDYYNKNAEFRTWLVDEKNKDFEDLSTSKAKELFKKFVKKWNKKKLPKKYYRGIDIYKCTASRTKYKWSFSSLNKAELSDIKVKVCDWNSPATFSTFGKAAGAKRPASMALGDTETVQTRPTKPKRRPLTMHDTPIGPIGPMPMPPSDKDKEEIWEQSHKEREGDVERKFSHAEQYQNRDTNKGPADRFSIKGADNIYKEKHKQKTEGKTEKYKQNLVAYQEKEAAKMKALLEMARANKSKDAMW